jgi:hypothetical protein
MTRRTSTTSEGKKGSESPRSPNRFAARVHVLLARDAPLGVAIRRGPSKRVCTVLWDRRNDSFRVGQWLNGRIYERRCDLSPDGKYLIYFAMNGRWQTEAKGSWTAISRAPYLKAIAMFPKGDCWHGGGLFTDKAKYWLNDGCGHSELRNTNEVRRNNRFQPSQYFGGECPGVYYPRLMRDGWNYLGRQVVSKGAEIDVFEKTLREGWVLRKLAHGEFGAPPGKGCYWDEHELFRPLSDKLIKYPAWEWAELDRNRLVWSTEGKLYAAHLRAKGIVDERELFDFNELQYEAIEAPY